MKVSRSKRVLGGVAVAAASSLFAAGVVQAATLNVSIINDNAFSPAKVKAQHGDTVTWTNNSMRQHNVTSDLGLFRSPRLAEDNTPGAHIQPLQTYSFSFTATGKYPYRCTLDGFTGTVVVPLGLAPASGTTATVFTLTWASAVPSGYVEDIQIKRPGATVFKDWKINQTATSSTFTPDKGTGTYSFQARLRNTASGLASAYTVPKSITVR